MASTPSTTAFGFLGTTLDSGANASRWDRWRPTVSLCWQDDLHIDRLLLFCDRRSRSLFDLIAKDIRQISPRTEVEPVDLPLADPWNFEEVYGKLLDFARGFAFDNERVNYLVHLTTGTHVAQICLFLLCETRRIPARLVQTGPPRKSARDARGSCQIIDLDLSRYDAIATRFRDETKSALSQLKSGIATENKAFNKQIERIEQVALASREPILLIGPTGAGKSQLAARIAELKRARHRLSGRFVEVNCATIRGDAAMSALFGHVKGAFTGAISSRAGLLKSADKGLLFLDEIAELGLDEQAMLLRAIEEKRFLPVGGDREEASDFQLVAGTNRDLFAAVEKGRFRDDLFARINLWTFRLPGLKDRLEDVEPNLEYELERLTHSLGRRVRFSTEARDRFLAFATSKEARWLGNFRDFNASLLRMATLAESGRITETLVDEEVARLRENWSRGEAPESNVDSSLLSETLGDRAANLDRFDSVQLADVIRACRASRSLSDAGRTLFAASRQEKRSSNDADRLRKYLARFELTFDRVRSPRP